MDFDVKVKIHDANKSAQRRGLGQNQRAQRFVDSEVLRLTDPYVPMDSGTLRQSGIQNTNIGSGLVRYRTPYARRLYYNPQFNFQGAPMRGGKWFERMKQNNKDTILRGAARIAGGKV